MKKFSDIVDDLNMNHIDILSEFRLQINYVFVIVSDRNLDSFKNDLDIFSQNRGHRLKTLADRVRYYRAGAAGPDAFSSASHDLGAKPSVAFFIIAMSSFVKPPRHAHHDYS